MRIVFVLFLWFAMMSPASQASDLDKEKRWADQIVDALIEGEAEWLEVGQVKFLGIYTESDEPTQRAALVLHGIGVHPDWPQVVYPLRTGLPAQGWSSLSLQMPVLPNDADPKEYVPLFDEVGPRIQAGIAFLKQNGATQIVIVAHSLGAAMASYYLAGQPEGIAALVGVGMTGGGDARMDNVVSLAKVRVPVLDVHGQNDLESVLGTSADRAKAAAGNPAFSQVQVPDADHFFEGHSDTLLKIVVDWLDETVPETSAPQT
jgi:predicted alpha/beta-hydrolase family hydrolase